MKRLLIIVEDEEYKKLKKAKEKMTWHDFLLSLVK